LDFSSRGTAQKTDPPKETQKELNFFGKIIAFFKRVLKRKG
jgi:hypothetical protein